MRQNISILIQQRKIHIRFRLVAVLAYALLIIPILIFFWGWLRWYFALLFSGILLAGFYAVYKMDYFNKAESIDMPVDVLLLIAAALGMWVLISGSSGVSVSNYDTPWRRAILRDLINYEWPVHYEGTGNYLVYYHVFYMIPAVIGKMFGWHAALIAQAVMLWLVIFTSFLLIVFVVHAAETKIYWLICLAVIGWSGLNALGSIFMQIFGWSLGGLGLGSNEAYCDALFNGESFNFFYRSNDNFIGDIYNQCMIWLAVPLMLENQKIHNYAFIGILLLPYSPWGVIGIAVLMVIDAVYQAVGFIREKHIKDLFMEIFSVQNICILASVGVVFGFYFSGTPRLNADGANFGILTLSKFDLPRIVGLVIFWLCEFGIYDMFLWKKYRKDHLFVWSLPVLMIIPICWAGSIWGRDFCMNASLPALYMLMVYMIVYIKDQVTGQILTMKNFIFLVCIFIAASTPILNWGSKVQMMIAEKRIAVTNDNVYTLSDKEIENCENFLTADDSEWYFKYIAKKR